MDLVSIYKYGLDCILSLPLCNFKSLKIFLHKKRMLSPFKDLSNTVHFTGDFHLIKQMFCYFH